MLNLWYSKPAQIQCISHTKSVILYHLYQPEEYFLSEHAFSPFKYLFSESNLGVAATLELL